MHMQELPPRTMELTVSKREFGREEQIEPENNPLVRLIRTFENNKTKGVSS
jgi:hypothetical protein